MEYTLFNILKIEVNILSRMFYKMMQNFLFISEKETCFLLLIEYLVELISIKRKHSSRDRKMFEINDKN